MTITVAEARKILGEKAVNMSYRFSDEELRKLINDLDFLAKAALDMAVKEKENELSNE